MKKREINIIKSESWLDINFDDLNLVLEEAVNDFVEDERIINIQLVKESSGLSRFWIYTEKIK